MIYKKSLVAAILLTFLFGPVGLFYASVWGGMIMTFTPILIAYCISSSLAGFIGILLAYGLLGFAIYWPVCILWSVIAVSRQNKRATYQERNILINKSYSQESANENVSSNSNWRAGKVTGVAIVIISILGISWYVWFDRTGNSGFFNKKVELISMPDKGGEEVDSFHQVQELLKVKDPDELHRVFGRRNVKVRRINGLDDDIIRGEEYVVFPDSKDEVAINFEQDYLRLNTPNSKWKLSSKLNIGLSMEDVIKLNGRDFKIFGFEWDYAGQVSDWNNGKLMEVGVVTFTPSQEIDYELYQKVCGGKEYSTSNKVIKCLKPFISEIIIFK